MVPPEAVLEIARIGEQASPNESCGLLICGIPGAPYELVEVENRAEDPTKDVLMVGEDVAAALDKFQAPPVVWEDHLVVWHTHPGGLVGPSKNDMIFRATLGLTRCLVVTLPGGEATLF